METFEVIQILEKASGVEPLTTKEAVEKSQKNDVKGYIRWLAQQSPNTWAESIPLESKKTLFS